MNFLPSCTADATVTDLSFVNACFVASTELLFKLAATSADAIALSLTG